MKSTEDFPDRRIYQEPCRSKQNKESRTIVYGFVQILFLYNEWNEDKVFKVKYNHVKDMLDYKIRIFRADMVFPDVQHIKRNDHDGDPEKEMDENDVPFFHGMAPCSKVKILCLPSTKNHNNNRLNGGILG